MKFDEMEIRFADVQDVVINQKEIWMRWSKVWIPWHYPRGQRKENAISDASMREKVLEYRDDANYRFWLDRGTLNIVHMSITEPHDSLKPTTFSVHDLKPTTFMVMRRR